MPGRANRRRPQSSNGRCKGPALGRVPRAAARKVPQTRSKCLVPGSPTARAGFTRPHHSHSAITAMTDLINRRSLFRLFGLSASCMIAAAALSSACARADEPNWTGAMPSYYGSYSMTIERAGGYGGAFQTYAHNGGMFVAGEIGERYNIRVSNNSARRVEAVVSVDGRDVLTGKVGNYRSQRGYVIEPYGSVVIEGFRQSLDSVAAFRFTAQSNSYSSRMGTAQNVGVIGVAVFEERAPKPPRRQQPVARPQDPYPRPYYDENAKYDAHTSTGGSSRGKGTAATPPADSPAPYYKGLDDGDYAAAEESRAYGGYVQPAPEKLGTEYGESTYSSVREVTFTRKNKSRPDAVLTMYYDSLEGLRARGVPVDPPPPYYPPYQPDPQPFPETRFAPPPPPRRW